MGQSIFDSTALPILQPRTHCVLIPRDPNFIYAYWDYTQEDIKRLRNQLQLEGAGSQFVLRVYDITHIQFNGLNATHIWDVPVGFSAKNGYINVCQDNSDYCAELGISRGENHFIPLIRSNTVHTPRKTASTRNDLIWQDIKTHKKSRPYLKEKTKGAKSSHSGKIYPLTAQDIRAYYMKLPSEVSKGRAPSLEDVLTGKHKEGSWQKVQPFMTCPDLIERIHPGASEGGLIEKKGAEGLLNNLGGASEDLLSSAGGASEGRLKQRKFFFEIWTELIVHGRTEPDAAVFLNQQGVKLNPDGTFSLRYALPDGEIPLKFMAQSSDGVEQRHINTRVEREKTVFFPRMLREFHG